MSCRGYSSCPDIPHVLQDIPSQGSVLFSYINSDDFCDQEDILKRVTTSEAEKDNRLFKKLMSDPKSRQQVKYKCVVYVQHVKYECVVCVQQVKYECVVCVQQVKYECVVCVQQVKYECVMCVQQVKYGHSSLRF